MFVSFNTIKKHIIILYGYTIYNNSNSNSSSGTDFLSDAAIPRFTGLSNSGEFFKSGSSILNDDIINASWSSEFKFL